MQNVNQLALNHIIPFVKQLVAEKSGISVLAIKESDHLVNDLALDSLDLVELAIEIEQQYGINLQDADVEAI